MLSFPSCSSTALSLSFKSVTIAFQIVGQRHLSVDSVDVQCVGTCMHRS